MKFFRLFLETRFARRLLVALTYASYIAVCWGGAMARDGSGLVSAVGFAITAAGGLTLFGGWLTMVGLMREYGFPGDSSLFTSRDERQTGVRHQAFVRAYGILSASVCLGCLYWATSPATGAWQPGPEYRNPLLFGLIFLSATLPSAVIAWTEPDPIPMESGAS